MLGHALLHIAAGQSLGVITDTLHRSYHDLIITHSHGVFPGSLFSFGFFTLFLLPFGFALGFGLFMSTALFVLGCSILHSLKHFLCSFGFRLLPLIISLICDSRQISAFFQFRIVSINTHKMFLL